MSNERYDFSGYATVNDLPCSDGRTIKKGAFSDCEGKTVPMVWNHRHDDPDMVIGRALLHNDERGVKAYCKLNDTDKARTCKELVKSGDITGLSIYANGLKQRGGDVLHGVIREVSLVLSGANPGALIDFDGNLAHSDDYSEMYAYLVGDNYTEMDRSGDIDASYFAHADDGQNKPVKEDDDDEDEGDGDGETVKDIIEAMSEKQKNAVYALIGAAVEAMEGNSGDEDEDEGDDKKMSHNAFENDNKQTTLCHSDMEMIIEYAKRPGLTLKTAINAFAEENDLQHDAVTSGFVQPNNDNTNGNVTWLFPEYKDVRPGAPELITNDQGWVSVVMNKVHKSPINRLRTSSVDIRNIESLRARGYQKGKQKQPTGNFELVRRTTDPQTVYVTSSLHRDDTLDVDGFDYVQYLYNIDRMNLNETLATAIMLGDGRPTSSEDKIRPEHIRPIWTDDELYTIHRDVDMAAARATLQGTDTASYFGDNYVTSEAMIEACLYSREDFKGTGTPDMFITPHMVNVMLLARDRNGRRIFADKRELAAAMNVGSIYTAEQFANRIRTDSQGNQHRLLAILVNLTDYTVGHTKGGEITHFTDFDIDFNLLKSLLETRLSGTLTRVYSAIVLEEPVA